MDPRAKPGGPAAVDPAPPLRIHRLLREATILPDLRSADRDGSLEEMAAAVAAGNGRLREKDLFEKLREREKLGSTAIGEGYAIPHCKLAGLDDPIVLLGVSRTGVEFGARDGKLAHVFFCVVSPAETPDVSLRILAAVAQLIRRSHRLQAGILKARIGPEILDLIRLEEEKPA